MPGAKGLVEKEHRSPYVCASGGPGDQGHKLSVRGEAVELR